MNTKYVIVSGFATDEETDMRRLKNYAKQGWILDSIAVGGFFFKLKKDEPKDIDYSLDYQGEADEEYFNLFSEAGWERVISIGKLMHIFSAPEGTKPIYSDSESEIDKYTRMKKQMRRGSIYSLIVTVALAILSVVSAITIKPIFLVTFSLFLLSIIVFVFNFMPYLAYSYRLKLLSKNDKSDVEQAFKLSSWKLFAFSSVCFMLPGIMYLIKTRYFFAGCFLLIAISNVFATISYYKKRK